jgi:hypothetical protein
VEKAQQGKEAVVTEGYEDLIEQNLRLFYQQRGTSAAPHAGARVQGDSLLFRAFGEECRIDPGGIALSGNRVTGPIGVVISLYLLHARDEPLEIMPFLAFKDFPGSMPYHGAFHANSEMPLVPHVPGIRRNEARIRTAFQGEDPPEGLGGDFSFVLLPLPKIALCYIFYLADDDFPASVTCLFSSNAVSFLPLDGLADTAEYTARRIIHINGGG